MLYSSSRDDLKRALGLGFFEGEFSATEKGEVSFEALQAALTKSNEDAPLTHLEKVRRMLGATD
jgi:hypothetical protein